MDSHCFHSLIPGPILKQDAPLKRTSRLLDRIQLSPTFRMEQRAAARRAQGADIVMLGAGEPDFPTPAFIIDAAFAAARAGQTRYTPMRGTLELRAAIRRRLDSRYGLHYEADQLIVTSGAKQALFNAIAALIEPGDEVLLPTPCWVSYADMTSMVGGQARYVPTRAEDGFILRPHDLARAIGPRTKLILFNSPNNPTGATYSREDWAQLGAVLDQHPGVMVICDDIYDQILIADRPYTQLLQACPQLYDRTLIVNGVSKTYAMTGWRLGYAAGPRDILAAMEVVQSQVTSCPSSVSQAAAVAALESNDALLRPMLDTFRSRHDRVLAALRALPAVHCQPAQGAFYLLPDVSHAASELARRGVIEDSSDPTLAEWLLQQHGVGLVPGSVFQAPGHLRLSFAASQTTLDDALRKLGQALELLR